MIFGHKLKCAAERGAPCSCGIQQLGEIYAAGRASRDTDVADLRRTRDNLTSALAELTIEARRLVNKFHLNQPKSDAAFMAAVDRAEVAMRKETK